MSLAGRINWEKVGGLIPAVIQDNITNQVLMLGYMNLQALQKTLEIERVTFWSRSKKRLWTKGESSGNFLYLVSMQLDCDQDTLLIKVSPEGATCHLGTETCFNGESSSSNSTGKLSSLAFLLKLESTLAARKSADPASSYTASLYASGIKRMAQKVGEEGVEVALAALSEDHPELVNESADLLYHLLVLLQSQSVSLADVVSKLKERNA